MLSGFGGQAFLCDQVFQPVRIEGAIDNSLYEAIDAQVPDSQLESEDRVRLAWDLADIYAWQVDFTRDIQTGDRFRVLYERLVSADGEVRFGRILAGDLTMRATLVAPVKTTARGDVTAGDGAAVGVVLALTFADHVARIDLGRDVIAAGDIVLAAEARGSSATTAAISAPKPPVLRSSWTIRQRRVRRTEASTISRSHGISVRRSMTSAEKSAAAASQRGTIAPQVTIVMSSPSRTFLPRPNGST